MWQMFMWNSLTAIRTGGSGHQIEGTPGPPNLPHDPTIWSTLVTWSEAVPVQEVLSEVSQTGARET
jgi:hypothetical protein